MKNLITLLSLLFMLLCSCSQRDTSHIYGDMSKDPRLVEIHQFFSTFRPESYSKAFQMVEEIDSTTLCERDYYEWLELKCTTASCANKNLEWIKDIQRWVEYADMKGSDRDVLSSHYWLSEAYSEQLYKFSEISQKDSIRNLQLQELFFCIHYRDEKDFPSGDYKYLLAGAYSELANKFRQLGGLNYLQMADYQEKAADLIGQLMAEDDSLRVRIDVPRFYRTLLRSAAIGYRDGGQYDKALACVNRCLEHAEEEGYLIDIYRCLGIKGSIEVWHRLDDKLMLYNRNYDLDDTWLADNLKYYDKGIREFPRQNTFALELFYYKAIAYLCCNQLDSAKYYIDKVYTPYELHWTKTLPDGTVKSQTKTTTLPYALGLSWENATKLYSYSDYIQAMYAHKHGDKETAYNEFKRITQSMFRKNSYDIFTYSPLAEKVAKSNIQHLKEKQRIQFYHTLAQIFGAMFVLMLILSAYIYFHNRKMRQLNASISILNHQLDELRAEKLQKQVTIESESETPLPDDGMEPVFINKLRLKHTAFQESSYFGLLSRIKLRYASSTNPESFRVTAEERHTLMDYVLSSFALECQQLQELYPTLTGTDSVYCILSLLDFGREVGSTCMEVSEEAFRRRKSRIKPKVSEALFACVFGKE